MTYTEAIANNAQYALPKTFKDLKSLGDGKDKRWFRDDDGKIGYVKTSRARTGEVLTFYPVKALKDYVYITAHVHSMAAWKMFEKL